MNDIDLMYDNDERLTSISRTATARDGAKIEFREDQWLVSDAVGTHYFTFWRLRPYASKSLINSLKKVTIHYIETHSQSMASLVFERFAAFLRSIGHHASIESVTVEQILLYKTTLNIKTEWYLGTLRGFFRAWYSLGLPNLDPDVVSCLDGMRLKGNPKGEAVRIADPWKGAFSDIEYAGIIERLNDGFAERRIAIEDYILIWLFLALGARAVQLATLKLSDLSVVRASNGTTTYILKIPRAKQRGQAPRTEFRNKKIVSEIGEVLEEYCQVSRTRWSSLGLDDNMIPFFVNPANVEIGNALRCHCTAADLSTRVNEIFGVLDIRSERTGTALKVSTRRFRYTVGTRAAREGASELVVAEILDHSDTQNVGVYVEAVPEIIERIDKAMAIYLAPLAQAFAGELINSEKEAIRAGDPRSRIVTPEHLERPVGSCGTYGFCGATAPIACYTCRNFQPWLDGPHEEVLNNLIWDRERIMDEIGDANIASINDRLILACAQVIRLCEARKAGATE